MHKDDDIILKSPLQLLSVASLGNFIQWFCFHLYAFMAPVFKTVFFPATTPYIASLEIWTVFALGFIGRPIGAVLFGHLGDKYGRKKSLIVSMLMMCISTIGIGLVPSTHLLGYSAIAFLATFRVLQGISLGGESSAAPAYLIELAPDNQRAFYSSWALFSSSFAAVLALVVTLLMSEFFGQADFASFAWRIPFFTGSLLGLVALMVRASLPESPYYLQVLEQIKVRKIPFLSFWHDYKWVWLKTSLLFVYVGVGAYTFSIYIATYYESFLGFSTYVALTITLAANVIRVTCYPIFARIGDTVGRKPILVYAMLAFMGSTLLFGYSIAIHHAHLTIIANFLAIGTWAAGASVGFAFLAEQYPSEVRVSGVGFSYHVPLALAGGTLPLFMTFAQEKLGTALAPVAVVFLMMIPAIVAVLSMRETAFSKLK